MILKLKLKKTKLRKEIKKKFLNYSSEQLENKSAIISNQVENYIKGHRIGAILCYYPIKNEVNILKSIKKWLKVGKKILLPSIIGGEIVAIELESLDNLDIGKFGIHEPKNLIPYKGNIDIAIVPGLVFSKEGLRIGKGFGYYDKFFSKKVIKNKIGICYDFQIKENIEKEDFDVNMDDVVYA